MLFILATTYKQRLTPLWHWYEQAMLRAEFGDAPAASQHTVQQSSHLDSQNSALRTP
ncbi:MAG: hypothetical protein J0M22_00550 [Gammaproteobacteria bacterium]|nr:hypothetical protein [Gammaproteobacteria bacterium]